MKKTSIFIVFIIISIYIVINTINSTSPEDARFKLGQMGIQYNSENFCNSIKNRDLMAINLFIKSKFDIECNFKGQTPLMFACKTGYIEIVKLLIDNGATINAKDKFYNRTPLMFASANGNNDIVKFLIDKGANINSIDAINENEISKENTNNTVNSTNTFKQLDYIYTDDVLPNSELYNCGRSPLMYGIIKQHFEIVKLLIAKGAIINIKTKCGSTPLSLACKYRYNNDNEPIIKYLLEKGAKVNFLTFLTDCCNPRPNVAHKECFDFIISNKNLFQMLLNTNISVEDFEHPDYAIQMLFLQALESENIDIIKLLIKKELNIGFIYTVDNNSFINACLKCNDYDILKTILTKLNVTNANLNEEKDQNLVNLYHKVYKK